MAANVQAMATSFKLDILSGGHNFNSTNVARSVNTVDTFKGALFVTNNSMGAATASYSTTGEVSGTNYTAGGVAVTNGTAPSNSGTVAIWTPSASMAWTTVTLSTAFDTLLLYNSFNANKAVGTFNFGSQTVTAGNFTLTMPVNASGTALVQIT